MVPYDRKDATMLIAIITFIILIFSIIVHEVAHGYAANALGDPTARLAKRLTLNPLPHIDLIGSIFVPAILLLTGSPFFFGWAKPVPYNPYNLKNRRFGEVIVASAGVITNLFIALIFGLLVRFGAPFISPNALLVAQTVVIVNLFLGIFNLIPFPPLDGFTILRGLLPWHQTLGFRRFEERVRAGGFVSLIIFLIVFSYFLDKPFFLFVSWIFSALTGVKLV